MYVVRSEWSFAGVDGCSALHPCARLGTGARAGPFCLASASAEWHIFTHGRLGYITENPGKQKGMQVHI